MNKSSLVSIIVPIYNGEAFLKECVNSVIAQTYTVWELILIDDGSSDLSASICKEFAKNDKRITFYHKNNTGVCDTRNLGLDKAKGKYVIFLDCDDYWCDKDILQILVNTAEENDVDIVRGEFKEIKANGDNLCIPNCDNKIKYIRKILKSHEFLSNVVGREYFLVLALIRRNKIDNIRFNTERIFMEDAEFYLRLLQKPLRCMYIPNLFYCYRKHEDSVTEKVIPNNNKLRDAFNFTRLCLDLAIKTSDNKMNRYLVKAGIDNFLFDIRVISTSKRLFEKREYWLSKWDLMDLYIIVRNICIKKHILSNYKLMILPIRLHMRLLSYISYVKSIKRKML